MLVGTCTPEIIGYSDIDEPFSRFFDIRDLHEFSETDSKEMVRYVINQSSLDAEIEDQVLERLHEETEGHPYHLTLFMHEIIRNKNNGTITLDDYRKSEPEIMRGVKTHLRSKFTDLTDTEISAIKSAVKVERSVFNPSDLDGVSSPSNICLQLCDKEVFERKGHGRYSFRHPMTRKYFEQEILS